MTKILVVDDDPVVRILVNEYLSAQGYEVSTLDMGGECLETARKFKPDVLLLDLMMPDITGLEVLKQMRAHPATARVPIVLMSSDFDTENLAQSHNVSADLYVQKPFGMQEILKALEQLAISGS